MAGGALIAADAVAPAAAQTRTAPEVVVTATRTEVPIEEVGNSVTVITAEEIARRQQRTIVEVLQSVPGLAVVQSGGPGQFTSVFIRGANANHTLVLVDGLRANDPSTPQGTFNFAHLLPEQVERVEIVRGPQSTLYGSDAIGGVINVITRKGSGKPSLTATAEAGSFNTYNAAVGTQGAIGRFNWNVGVTRLQTGGFSITPSRYRQPGMDDESDPATNLTVVSRLGVDVTDNFEVGLISRFIRSYTEYDGSYEDPDTREHTHQQYHRLTGVLDLFDGRWRQTFGAGYVHIKRQDTDDPDAFNPFSSRADVKGERLKFDWQNDIQVTSFYTLTIGAETEEEKFSSTAFGSTSKANERTSGFFLTNQFTILDDLFLSLGGRIDDTDSFGSETTWRIAASYLLRDTGTRFKAAYGTGFKAPTLFQLYGSNFFFTGNPNLQPETSKGWEAGIEQTVLGGRLSFGATYFANDIDNLIVSTADFSSNENLAKARTRGIEAFIAAAPIDRVKLRLDYTYTEAEDPTTGTALLRRPKHKAGFTADWTATEALTLGMQVVYSGERADISNLTFGRVYPSGYTLATLTAAYRLTEKVELFGRVVNLFDKQYDEPDGFEHARFGAFAGVRTRF